MNNEIKEILEDVKRHLDYVEATKQCSIRDNEMKVMYDYITNLHKENKMYAQLKDEYEDIIDKALDKLYNYGLVFDSKILQEFQKDMENILKGEDND